MAGFDVLIRGGLVVDGAGRPPRRADVAIRDGRIAAIEPSLEGGGEAGDRAGAGDRAATVIDATGRIVAPGFVDVHTHYDAQVFWDPALTPSPLHGVTTVLAGNCGFGIAPLSGDAADGEYLMRMLARVEGMSLESLRQGVPWSWRSMTSYLDAIDGTLGVNAGFMVGHSALRRAVMGPGATGREATGEEIDRMGRLLHESLEAGGIGFSSSWARTHNDAEGAMVPSRYASRHEVLALCAVAGRHEGTSLEFIPQVGPRFDPWATEIMAAMSAAAGRPLNWNVLAVNARNLDDVYSRLEASDAARRAGGKVVALTVPQNFAVRLNFSSGFVLDAMPGWERAMLLPRAEKLALFRDKAARDQLNALAQAPDNPLRGVANWAEKRIFDVVAPENEQYRGRSVGEIAAEQDRDPWDTLVDIALADELRTSFGSLAAPDTEEDWKARVEVWRDGRAVIGASDAGAHLDMLATFNYTTMLMDQAVRRRGLLAVEEAVHLLTDVPARLYGLRQRGRLEPGWHADVVVFDPGCVGSQEIAMRYDLPGGAGRLHAEAVGIDHVLVNGRPIVAHGALTDERAGTLLRSGADTATPDL